MKALWITLGVLAALGLVCCGGVFVFGKGVFESAVASSDAANKFSDKMFPEIAKDWDPKVIAKYASPEFERDVSQRRLEKALSQYKNLGTFKSVEPFSSAGYQANTVNGESAVTVTTKALATFEKGTAMTTLKMIGRKGDWKLLHLNLESDLLD